MKKTTIVLSIIAVIAAVIITVNIFKKDNKDKEPIKNYIENKGGIKINTSDNIKKDKEVEGIKIQKQSLVYSNGSSKLISNITNTTNETKAVSFKIIFIGEKGQVIIEALGYVGNVMPGETRQLDSEITTDVSNAKDVKYEVIK